MKTTNDYLVSELDRNELRSINGGGFWRDLGWTIGRAFGRAWCWMKEFEYEVDEYTKLKRGGL